ncbi:hypothetical protein [Streptomyces sp. WAC08241]|uniref:hypothetical protein n=1 Tax=Streptomyces sp. WAC08241 TaxID=2487421 RepID=UPI00163D08EA|nr:hypothetical protein [Streptomyces sp. WAC08241]
MLRAAVATTVTAVAFALVALGGTATAAERQDGTVLAVSLPVKPAAANEEPIWG